MLGVLRWVPSRAECYSLVRKPRPELESHFSSLCTPGWFGVLSAAPFWERRGRGSISASVFRLIARSVLTVQSSGAARHAALGRGSVETAPNCGRGGCFELGPSQTWRHVIPGCVGHWHAGKPWGPAELRGELCQPWLKLTVCVDPQGEGLVYLWWWGHPCGAQTSYRGRGITVSSVLPHTVDQYEGTSFPSI